MWVDSAERPVKGAQSGMAKWETLAGAGLLIHGARNGGEGRGQTGREDTDGHQPRNSDCIFNFGVVTISFFQINDTYTKKWNKACPWLNLRWIYYLHFFHQGGELIISLFSDFFFLSLLWITKFCFKSKQNRFFRGSKCRVRHKMWVLVSGTER